MRHPFQRKGNRKDTVQTPFQKALVVHLQDFAGGDVALSGRQLSLLMGRSPNHMSQIVNDGFIPSGQTILEMAEVLHLDRAQTDALIRAALETKVKQRSRDQFWILQTKRMLEASEKEARAVRDFLEAEGLKARFDAFKAKRRRKGRKPAPGGPGNPDSAAEGG